MIRGDNSVVNRLTGDLMAAAVSHCSKEATVLSTKQCLLLRGANAYEIHIFPIVSRVVLRKQTKRLWEPPVRVKGRAQGLPKTQGFEWGKRGGMGGERASFAIVFWRD